MKKNDLNDSIPTKNLIRVVVVSGLILLIPLLAMVLQWPVSDPGNPEPETVNWDLFDFVVMGALLLSTGFAYEYLALRFTTTTKKLVLAAFLGCIFLLIWAELAVGIFGSPFAGS